MNRKFCEIVFFRMDTVFFVAPAQKQFYQPVVPIVYCFGIYVQDKVHHSMTSLSTFDPHHNQSIVESFHDLEDASNTPVPYRMNDKHYRVI